MPSRDRWHRIAAPAKNASWVLYFWMEYLISCKFWFLPGYSCFRRVWSPQHFNQFNLAWWSWNMGCCVRCSHGGLSLLSPCLLVNYFYFKVTKKWRHQKYYVCSSTIKSTEMIKSEAFLTHFRYRFMWLFKAKFRT